MQYADSPAAWDRVVEVCRRAGKVGFDTETYGHNIEDTSAPHRARVHVWSLAVRTGAIHPRGFRKAKGVMLSAAALEYRPIIRLLEDEEVIKLAHNLPHDQHSVRNHGIRLRGGIDTLPKCRLVLTDEVSHSLKPLMERKLGRKVITFKEVVAVPNEVVKVKVTKHKACVCGTEGCRRRGPAHPRVKWRKFTPERVIKGLRNLPLESIVPGHFRFPLLTVYAIQDAEGVLEIDDYTDRAEVWTLRQRGDVDVPWAA